MSDIDPTTLAVVRGYLEEVADEMDLVQVKAAFSQVVSEMKDRANGVFRADTGETVAQGHYGSPIFITTMQGAVQSVVNWLDQTGQTWEPGDAYILNDPYIAGTHLQDAKLVAPFFWEGEPVLLLANTGHWMDVGAAQAGAFGPTCTSIFEEGLRLPVMRLVREGTFVPEVLELIRVNNRLPDQQEGDLRSQYNALMVGARRLERLFERYGAAALRSCVDELERRSERQMRRRVSEIPDGCYRASDVMDDDGLTDTPLQLELALTVRGDELLLDFAGSAPMCEGPMNMARPTTVTACYTGLKHLFPEIPINAGCFRPVTVEIPEGSLLDARPPRAVGGYADVSARIVGLVAQALATAQPENASATSFETGGVAVISGEREEGGVFVAAFPYGGGYGARQGEDGLVNGTSVVGMATFPSIEASERDVPVRWNAFCLREDSGGDGRWIGGCGNVYDFTVESPTDLSILGDQSVCPPAGVQGGSPGAPNEVAYTQDGRWVKPPRGVKVAQVRLAPGEHVRLCSPGGGGFGDPSERAPVARDRDHALGIVTSSEPSE